MIQLLRYLRKSGFKHLFDSFPENKIQCTSSTATGWKLCDRKPEPTISQEVKLQDMCCHLRFICLSYNSLMKACHFT